MKAFYETDEFKKQRDEWYAKLAADGYKDIEIIDKVTDQPSLCLLKGMSVGDLRRGLYKEETVDYYRFARQHVWTIRVGVRRHVWRLHAEGYSQQRILEALGERYGLSLSKISGIIEKERTRMKKMWNKAADKAFQEAQRDENE